LTTGSTLHKLAGHTSLVTDVVVTPDGDRVVSTSLDNMLNVWDLATGALLKTLRGHPDSVEAVALTPDGKLAISCGVNDARLRVWDLRTGEAVRSYQGLARSYGAVVVTPDGRRVIAASSNPWDALIEEWDLRTGDKLMTIRGEHKDLITGLVLAPNGREAVSVSLDHTLKLWNLDSGELVASFSADGGLVAVAIAPDGETFIAGEEAGRIHHLRLQRHLQGVTHG
jgi:WD40 repeat protein